MTSRKKTIARIKKFTSSMEWMFCMNQMDRNIEFIKEDAGDKVAHIKIDKQYQFVTICIYPIFFKETIENQRKELLHEFCHYIVYDQGIAALELLDGKLVTEKRIKDIDEETTSKIENIIHNLLIGKLKYAKEAYKNYLK